ncbi:uncharacterized protein LOC110690769 [Chenopodium quinoa]|uniref:uncharacterized protein LOC110690769 n=1 Tax=Chenopodium quinoa TaxID=63459 RepID=UPI000B76CA8D|nr:uncharacterized protein LOC110690769 [Chenopodium quinoa]
MELEFELGMEFERERQEVVAYEQQRVGDLDLLLCSFQNLYKALKKLKLKLDIVQKRMAEREGLAHNEVGKKGKIQTHLCFLKSQSFRDNHVLLSVDGIQVTLHMCAGIAAERGQVFDAYVSAAGKLYEKVWAARYADRSKRFMLDPMFAMRVFQRREMVINTRVFTPQMDGVRPKRINVVFVPVLFEGHWWCVAFSVNREEILVIDSIQTSSASEVHSANVDHLAYAMDLVFQSLDPKWEVGTVTAWRRTSLQMAQQGDL